MKRIESNSNVKYDHVSEYTQGHVIWKKAKIKSFYFDFLFKNEKDFRDILLSNFEIGNDYSILIRVEYNGGRYAMLGTQIALSFETIDYTEIKSTYDKILERLGYLFVIYQIDTIDSIQVLFVAVKLLPKLKLTNVNSVTIPNIKGVDLKDIKSKYNYKFLPLTVNDKYFGKLQSDDLDLLNLINKQKLILNKTLINKGDFDSMYLYDNKYIILSKQIDYNVFDREIYDVNLGVFEGKFRDIIWDFDTNSFDRIYKDQVKFSIVKSNLSLVSITKDLSVIKYIKSAADGKALVSNPYIGTFDLETFDDFDGYSKVYAAGFCVKGKSPITYYLDNKEYDSVLLKCIDNMLIPKYDGYIFYVHNLDFDGVFIIHYLKLFNKVSGFEHYKINTLYKDSSLLKIEISIERELDSKRKQKVVGVRQKSKPIKITFVDSSNLLRGKLRDLCAAFDLESVKGHFPYSFVNSDTLNYIGITPDFKS